MKKILPYLTVLTLTVALCGACASDNGASVPTSVPTEASPTPAPAPKPTAKPRPTPTPFVVDETVTLMDTYGTVFAYSGVCIAHATDLENVQTVAAVKEHYNSVTLENESKPDFMLGSTPTLITIEEAKKMGYRIPDNYTDNMVPKLDFTNVDLSMKLCSENELGFRFHTLVWHSQSPNWFFREDYNGENAFVTPEVMDARMEFYIRTIMSHVYESEYSHCVYAWDVVNEYLNADDTNWIAIYGKKNQTPDFVKKAFEIADAVLQEFGIRDKVSLIFNDYNTYSNATKLISIMEFINSERRICDGFGMQAHLSVSYPYTDAFVSTAKRFSDAGYEVQITELDVACSNDKTQADYYYYLMKGLLELKKEGGNVTGITYWGMSDSQSWRSEKTPLLFSTPGEKKSAYYSVLKAYIDAGYIIEE